MRKLNLPSLAPAGVGVEMEMENKGLGVGGGHCCSDGHLYHKLDYSSALTNSLTLLDMDKADRGCLWMTSGLEAWKAAEIVLGIGLWGT